MATKFPHILEGEGAAEPYAIPRTPGPAPADSKIDFVTEPIGSRRGRRNVRIPIEAAAALKARLETLAFETSLSVAEICRHALWRVVLEAEANKQKFVERVARDRMAHRAEERP